MEIQKVEVGHSEPECPCKKCQEYDGGDEVAGDRISYSLDWGLRRLSRLYKAHNLANGSAISLLINTDE